ncbi:MAG: hypothetical protein ACE5H1_04200 [Thermodesulfobacteriota bacterium]
MPREVVEALELMIVGDKKGWGVTGWRREIRSIISIVIQSDNREAREAAIDLVHRLGALGHLEFRDLLPNSF